MIKAVPQLTVDDETPVKLNVFSDSDYRMGSSVFITTSGPLHFGGDTNVRHTAAGGSTYRGSLHGPLTGWPVELDPGEDLYAIAPSGETVTVEVLQGGV